MIWYGSVLKQDAESGWFSSSELLGYFETDLKASNSIEYLHDIEKSKEYKEKAVIPIDSSGKPFSEEFLKSIESDPAKGIILIEGRAAQEASDPMIPLILDGTSGTGFLWDPIFHSKID